MWRKHPPALALGSFSEGVEAEPSLSVGRNPDDHAPHGHFIEISGADGGTRTRTPKRTTDFKSVASTIPPHPHDIAQTALRPHGQGALQPKLIC